MALDLAAVIDEARTRAFVGRDVELASFERALTADAAGPSRRVLFVYGPGGIGKTALLHQFRRRARARGRVAVTVDGRDVDCSSEGLRSALDDALAKSRGSSRGGNGRSQVLLLDGYDRFGPIDGWVRDELLPSLDAGAVVVLLGRDAPSAAWRTDPGWRAVTAVHPLPVLTEAESVELLARAEVPDGFRCRLAALGQGHPLTLALLADATASGRVPDDLAELPDLVATLVAQVVGEAPGEAHVLGLALCAHAWLTTEDLLRSAVGDRAPEVWAWLEAQPWVTRGADGLYPHELVRDVLDADLRSRSPETFRRVNRIVHELAVAGMRRHHATDQRLWAYQKLYLHRRSPFASAFWALRERGSAAVVAGRPEDHREVLEVIERYEGGPSAAVAERWLDAEPQNLMVMRHSSGVVGFMFQVVHPTDPALCAADPVVRTALDHAARISPARPGEQITVARFVGGPDGHQRDAHAVLVASVGSTVTWLTRPLAWSFCAVLDCEFWRPAFQYLGLTTEFEAEFEGLRYTVFGIDWRRCPVEAWLELMAERELTGATGPPPPELLRPPPLDRARFDEAVRAALRDLHAPDRLKASPLTGSGLAVGFDFEEGAGPERAAERLRATLIGGIEQVGREPRAEALCRVLQRTFVRPAPTQEAAAEVLGLPFSTYRRHLGKAVERLTDLLWAVEIGEVRLGER
ncbi:AAA family ATPase [Streptomyces fulvoviolaceus]|uniref:AAA family ATPase n=1 Tax=Streptomyces fulvoviolaceus TaxID=285535 RepID=UPI0004CA5692|nr:ATP-binding protein [Streptomyces fulvoviolaceus]MCT9080103.1 ATP-binding protein [Streptomyces fulvoviolaceus]